MYRINAQRVPLRAVSSYLRLRRCDDSSWILIVGGTSAQLEATVEGGEDGGASKEVVSGVSSRVESETGKERRAQASPSSQTSF